MRPELVVVFLCASGSLAMAANAENEVDQALDLVLGALRNQGRNSRLIHRGEFEYKEITRNAPATPEQVEMEIEQTRKGLEDLAANAPSDIERENYKKMLSTVEADVKSGIEARANTTFLKEVYFEGNNPRENWVESATYVDPETGPGLVQHSVAGGPEQNRTFLNYAEGSGEAHLSNTKFSARHPEYFGRARSKISILLTILLAADGGDLKEKKFAPRAVEELKELFRNIAKQHGREEDPPIVSTSEFEGSKVYTVQMGAPDGIVLHRLLRMTIDPGRGYIVPREEELVHGKVVSRFESSDYELDKTSGLWFPRRSKESYFDPGTGKTTSEVEYQFSKVVINQAAKARPFGITLAKGEKVADFRGGKRWADVYRVNSPSQSIVLKDGQVDLLAIGLTKEETLKGNYLPTKHTRRRGIYLFGGLVVACLVAVAYRFWNKG